MNFWEWVHAQFSTLKWMVFSLSVVHLVYRHTINQCRGAVISWKPIEQTDWKLNDHFDKEKLTNANGFAHWQTDPLWPLTIRQGQQKEQNGDSIELNDRILGLFCEWPHANAIGNGMAWTGVNCFFCPSFQLIYIFFYLLSTCDVFLGAECVYLFGSTTRVSGFLSATITVCWMGGSVFHTRLLRTFVVVPLFSFWRSEFIFSATTHMLTMHIHLHTFHNLHCP